MTRAWFFVSGAAAVVIGEASHAETRRRDYDAGRQRFLTSSRGWLMESEVKIASVGTRVLGGFIDLFVTFVAVLLIVAVAVRTVLWFWGDILWLHELNPDRTPSMLPAGRSRP